MYFLPCKKALFWNLAEFFPPEDFFARKKKTTFGFGVPQHYHAVLDINFKYILWFKSMLKWSRQATDNKGLCESFWRNARTKNKAPSQAIGSKQSSVLSLSLIQNWNWDVPKHACGGLRREFFFGPWRNKFPQRIFCPKVKILGFS